MSEKSKLVWTEENTKSVKEYKTQVQSGQIRPIVLSGSLREIVPRK